MNSLSRALREAASSRLPDRAFLRRDRGDALFVTDAPRLFPETDWAVPLEKAGFGCAVEGGLMRLTPGPLWLTGLEAAYPDPPGPFCAAFQRFLGLDPEPESLLLFALGARILDGDPDFARFDRLLRRRAAECLRLNRTHPLDSPLGGGLYACALLEHEMEVR